MTKGPTVITLKTRNWLYLKSQIQIITNPSATVHYNDLIGTIVI